MDRRVIREWTTERGNRQYRAVAVGEDYVFVEHTEMDAMGVPKWNTLLTGSNGWCEAMSKLLRSFREEK